ncbi:polyprenyl synthetase family protein [Ktedonosporobacter rubrisoli]|uniref:polyprenyl synthetase family protein n=1 Tax=Ktedonosporobacter rubrisoli TaxID=2509675 RepID=UPI0030F3EC9C
MRPSIDTLLVSSIAVAVECVVCAIDLLDDIEDEDQTPVVREIGSARVVNTAAALLLLGQKCIIASAQFGLLPAQVLNLLDTLQDATLIVTTGQHRDILVEERQASEMTREECMDIAAQKAGALFVLACQMATLCAGADKELAKLFCELGSVLGIAHQLDNDSHDLYHLLQGKSSIVLPLGEEASTRSVKTDLSRRKKTLPIVLAARSGASLTEMVPVTGEDCDEEERQALHEAILTTWGISLLYRERARDFLQRIEIRRPVLPALRLLLGLT